VGHTDVTEWFTPCSPTAVRAHTPPTDRPAAEHGTAQIVTDLTTQTLALDDRPGHLDRQIRDTLRAERPVEPRLTQGSAGTAAH